MLNQEQKELLFKLAVRELGFEAYIDDRDIDITTKKSNWSTQYIIGRFVKSKQEYRMYGSPKTNKKIINLIKDNFGLETKEITAVSDTNMKYNEYPMFL